MSLKGISVLWRCFPGILLQDLKCLRTENSSRFVLEMLINFTYSPWIAVEIFCSNPSNKKPTVGSPVLHQLSLPFTWLKLPREATSCLDRLRSRHLFELKYQNQFVHSCPHLRISEVISPCPLELIKRHL